MHCDKNEKIDLLIYCIIYNISIYLHTLYKHLYFQKMNSNDMIQIIKESVDDSYIKIKNESDIESIYNMFKHDKVIEEHNNDIEILYYIAVYYKTKNDTVNMIKYYKIAAENGCDASMNNLGIHFMDIDDTENMMKYYTMAIEKGNTAAMNNLGTYYHNLEDYENMMKYYVPAINDEITGAMLNMALYYEKLNDYDNMLKYHFMALDNGDYSQIKVVIEYYLDNDMTDEYFNLLAKYIKAPICQLEMKKILSNTLTRIVYINKMKTRIIETYNNVCPVCLSESSNNIKLMCKHVHCLTCLKSMIVAHDYKCSLCREMIC